MLVAVSARLVVVWLVWLALIDAGTVSDFEHQDGAAVVLDTANDPVVAHAVAPQAPIWPCEGLTARVRVIQAS